EIKTYEPRTVALSTFKTKSKLKAQVLEALSIKPYEFDTSMNDERLEKLIIKLKNQYKELINGGILLKRAERRQNELRLDLESKVSEFSKRYLINRTETLK